MQARSALRPPLAALFVLSAIGLSFAQSSYESAKSNSVLDAIQTYESARSAGSLSAVQQAQQVRSAALAQLMQSDPAAVLADALPANVLARLPRAAQAVFEKHVVATGVLEVAVEDGLHSSKMHYNMVIGGGRLGLHFAGAVPGELLTGMFAQVKGVQVGAELALNSTDLKTSTTASSTTSGTRSGASTSVLPNTFGAQKTLVILVNFQDNTSQPYTAATAQDVVFNQASNFWLENSFQQTWITGDVAGWFTLALSAGTACPTSSIQTYAQQAAQNAGYALGNYSRFVYVFPHLNACSWLGYSFVGGSPSQSWINGYLTQQIVNHELGHAFGLYHSHALNCGAQVYTTSGCTQYEYGDSFDSMSNSNFNGGGSDYNSFQKERLGWLGSGSQPAILAVTTSGTYTVSAYETQDSTAKALKVLQSSSTSGDTSYYVEARQALGFDGILSNLGYGNVTNGILLHVGTTTNANSSNLLNANPSSSWGSVMALTVGQSYTDATAGLTITPVSVGGAGATVQVTYAGPVCTPANPSVIVNGPASTVAAGATASYIVSIRNNDSSACASSTFALSTTTPAGWNASYSTVTVTLAPGASGSIGLSVVSPANTPNGTYTVAEAAVNTASSSYSGSASGTETIYTPAAPTLFVSTNSATYSLGQTVSVTTTVASGSAPLPGVNVSVIIKKPNGNSVSLSGTTAANGAAVVSYKLQRKDSKGTWSVAASADGAGASSTFTVQ